MIDLGHGVTLLERADTGVTFAGRPKMGKVSTVVGHHSVTGPLADPAAEARHVDSIGRNTGLRAFPYSYGVHPTGVVVEGQGEYVGAHTLGWNTTAIGVALLGTYTSTPPNDAMVRAWRALIAWLIDRDRLAPGAYPTVDHAGTGFATACWGDGARSRLAAFRAPIQPVPTPQPTPVEDDMLRLVYDPNVWGNTWFLDSGMFARPLRSYAEAQRHVDLGQLPNLRRNGKLYPEFVPAAELRPRFQAWQRAA